MFGCGAWSPILDLGCVRSQSSPDEQTISFSLQGVYKHAVFANGGSIYVDVKGVAVTAAGGNEGTDGERLTCAR